MIGLKESRIWERTRQAGEKTTTCPRTEEYRMNSDDVSDHERGCQLLAPNQSLLETFPWLHFAVVNVLAVVES
jgi:hypothetical protein